MVLTGLCYLQEQGLYFAVLHIIFIIGWFFFVLSGSN